MVCLRCGVGVDGPTADNFAPQLFVPTTKRHGHMGQIPLKASVLKGAKASSNAPKNRGRGKAQPRLKGCFLAVRGGAVFAPYGFSFLFRSIFYTSFRFRRGRVRCAQP